MINDSIQNKLFLLVHPTTLMITLVIFFFMDFENSWVFAMLTASIVSTFFVFIKTPQLGEIFQLDFTFKRETFLKTITIVLTGLTIPFFMHADLIILSEAEILADFAIVSKFLYSVPLSLSSLYLLVLFKKQNVLTINVFLFVLISSSFSILAMYFYEIFTDISAPLAYYIWFVYALVFTLFNLMLSLSVMRSNLSAIKSSFFVCGCLLFMTLIINISFLSFILMKLLLMVTVIMYLTLTDKNGHRGSVNG